MHHVMSSRTLQTIEQNRINDNLKQRQKLRLIKRFKQAKKHH